MKKISDMTDEEIEAAKKKANDAYIYSIIHNGTVEQRLQLSDAIDNAIREAKQQTRFEIDAPKTLREK